MSSSAASLVPSENREPYYSRRCWKQSIEVDSGSRSRHGGGSGRNEERSENIRRRIGGSRERRRPSKLIRVSGLRPIRPNHPNQRSQLRLPRLPIRPQIPLQALQQGKHQLLSLSFFFNRVERRRVIHVADLI